MQQEYFFVESQLYCEILEFQFVSGKIESDSTITVLYHGKQNLIPIQKQTHQRLNLLWKKEFLF